MVGPCAFVVVLPFATALQQLACVGTRPVAEGVPELGVARALVVCVASDFRSSGKVTIL
jgi:hypothetical protein